MKKTTQDFTDCLIEEYLTEASSTSGNSNKIDWFDFFDGNPKAAIYAAREITYKLVSNPKQAKALYKKMEQDLELDEDELIALDSLLADALEGANYNREAMNYAHNRHLPLTLSYKTDTKTQEYINDGLRSASRAELISILADAINTLVLDDYLR